MREFKSTGYNYLPIMIWMGLLLGITRRFHTFDFVLDNIYYVMISLLCVIVVSINVVSVNRKEITKQLYLIPVVLKRKTWREITYYMEVDEIYSGQYGKSTTKAIWFIGNNNKVCLRFEKSRRQNLDEILNVIDTFETKNNNKLTITNPYFMCKGWTKVKHPEPEQSIDSSSSFSSRRSKNQ